MSNQKITDHRPHFVPAIYNWMAENFGQIYVSFLRNHSGVDCPPCKFTTEQFGAQTDEQGPVTLFNIDMVTLNFSPEAVGAFAFDNEGIVASIRFGGQVAKVKVPFTAIKRMYAPERTDLGYFLNQPFSEEDIEFTQEALNKSQPQVGQPATDPVPTVNKDRPTLVRVK